MTRICAWCDAALPPPVDPRWESNAGSWQVDDGPDGLVSHGICERCLESISLPEPTGTPSASVPVRP